MSLEAEAQFLQAGTRAGLIDPEKGTAALFLYSQLLERGAQLTFIDFLLDRNLITRMGLDALERQMQGGAGQTAVRTTSQLDEFELQEVIGEGTTGTVFRALPLPHIGPDGQPIHHPDDLPSALVALKVLAPQLAADQEALNTFLNEGYLCSKLNHPHIVKVFRVGSAEGLYYMVMELVEGGSARKLMERTSGRLEERRALEIGVQIASGLAAAHASKLIHRDVKPENILLDVNGNAKLADLGLALRIGAASGQDGGEFSGTPGYVAPEVITGYGQPSAASDLFGLGATLFDLMTGYPPFMGGSPEEMLRQTVNAPPPRLRSMRPDCSIPTEDFVNRMLNKHPQMRPTSAKAAAQELGKILKQLDAPPPELAPLPKITAQSSAVPISATPTYMPTPAYPNPAVINTPQPMPVIRPSTASTPAIVHRPTTIIPPTKPIQRPPPPKPTGPMKWQSPHAAGAAQQGQRPPTGAALPPIPPIATPPTPAPSRPSAPQRKPFRPSQRKPPRR